MIEYFTEALRRIAPRSGLPAPPRVVHLMKLAQGEPALAERPVVLLLFADNARTPAAVVKVGRTPTTDGAILDEAARLTAMRTALPDTLRPLVPEPWGTGRVQGCAYLLMQAMPGELEQHHTWNARALRRTPARLAAALQTAWTLAHADRAEAIGLAAWSGLATPEAALERLRARGLPAAVAALLRPRLEPLWEARWPAGPAHGDYFAGNLVFRGGAVSGILDWSHARSRAPVFQDTLTYLHSFAVQAYLTRGHATAFQRQGLYALETVRRSMQRFIDTHDLDLQPGSDAAVASLVEWGTRERAQPDPHADSCRAAVQLLIATLGNVRSGNRVTAAEERS